MCHVLGYQKVKCKNGKFGFFLWLAEDASAPAVGQRCFQEFLWEDQLPELPDVGSVICIYYSRNVNPRTNRPYILSVEL